MDSPALLKRCLREFVNKKTGEVPLEDAFYIIDRSDTERLKLVITESIKNSEGKAIPGYDIPELMESFGLSGIVSKNKFTDTLGSLSYKDKKIKVQRPSKGQMGISEQPIRTYLVTLR